ncbi:MAG TPA: alpha/beta fold hydrolase [Holophagaceae bacterium]|nr:alpha/beta fold hydrolase [Holophagaceae bacterium]
MRTLRTLALLPVLASGLLASEPTRTEVSLKTPDGCVIAGTFTLPAPARKGAKAPVVIFAHQFRTDRKGWGDLPERLQARGIATLALDLRGHGESLGPARVTEDFAASAKAVGFDKIPSDLALAAAWVRKQPGVDKRRLALAGSSVGAFSAILAAREARAVAVLALSPAGAMAFGDGALDHLKAAQLRGRTATLLFASEQDKGAMESAHALAGLPGVATSIRPGDEHGFAYLKARGETMAVFLGEYLHSKRVFANGGTPAPKANPNVINDATLKAKAEAAAPKP